MRIDRVDLIAYGGFTNVSLNLDADSCALHVVYGANESGKSTSLRAITAWLFGIPSRTDDSYLHNYSDLRVGGKITSAKYGVVECVRRKGNSKTLLTPDESSEVDEQQLRDMLGNMDEATFLRGFGLDRDRLVEGGQEIMQGGGDLGELLFSAGVGVHHLNRTLERLDARRSEVFVPAGRTRQLNLLLNELKELRAELSSGILSATEYRECQEGLESAQREADACKLALKEARERLTQSQRQLDAIPIAKRRRELAEELVQLMDVPELDDDFLTRRRDADTEGKVAADALKRVSLSIKELEEKIEQLGQPNNWLVFADRIESLVKRSELRRKELGELSDVARELSRLDAQLAKLRNDLSGDAETRITTLSVAVRENIRELETNGLRLREQRQATTKELERRREELLAAKTALENLPAQDIPDVLRDALNAIESPARLEQSLKDAVEAAERTYAKGETLCKRLTGFKGDFQAAAAILLPDETAVDLSGQQCQITRARIQQLEAERVACEDDRLKYEAELAGFKVPGSAPSDAELRAARQRRDEVLKELYVQESADLLKTRQRLERLEVAIREADELADAMRTGVDQVVRRLRLEQDQLAKTSRLLQLDLELERQREILSEQEGQWNALWRSAGIEPGSPESMRSWREQHTRVYECWIEFDVASRKRVAADSAVSDWRQRALETLAALGETDTDPTTDLATLFACLMRLKELHAATSEEARRKHEEFARVEREVERAQREQTLSEQEFASWQQEWRTLWQSLGDFSDDEIDPREARRLVDAHEEFRQANERLEALRSKAGSIEEHAQSYLREIASLCVALQRAELIELESDDGRVLESVDRDLTVRMETGVRLLVNWQTRLKERELAAHRRQTFEEQLVAARTQLVQLSEARERCRITLETLREEVGCESVDQIPEVERASLRKRQVVSESRELASRLSGLAQGMELDDFAEQVLGLDEAGLREQQVEWRNEIELAEDRLSVANQRVGALVQLQAAMDGGDTAAEINQRIEAGSVKLQKLAHEYAVLTVQTSALRMAMERYREANQGPIVGRATEIFRRLTLGAYSGLSPRLDEKGRRVLTGTRTESGKQVPVQQMSQGTADALFLALRLASLQTHLEARPAVPLIMDDILVQFDDERAAATLGVLEELSRQTQVIFFTHHRHVVELAEQTLGKDAFQLLELA